MVHVPIIFDLETLGHKNTTTIYMTRGGKMQVFISVDPGLQKGKILNNRTRATEMHDTS